MSYTFMNTCGTCSKNLECTDYIEIQNSINLIHSKVHIGYGEVVLNCNQNIKKDNLTFGEAIKAMKKGFKVAREFWDDKGMFIALSPGCKDLPSERFWCEHNKKFAEQNGGKADVLPYITMKTADNKILSGWLASQADMLSNDWVIVE